MYSIPLSNESENNVMKTTRAGSISSFSSLLIVKAVQLDLFVRLLFMGRRKKAKYLTRTLFRLSASRR